MAGLSTHVLDTSKGKPAVELKIELYKILDIEKILIKTVFTNADGRIDEPLLSAESLEEINYELLSGSLKSTFQMVFNLFHSFYKTCFLFPPI